MKKSRNIILLIAALILIVGSMSSYYLWNRSKDDAVQYTTAEIKRGDISYDISATGNLNDSLSIDVGTQVSGIISQIFVDFNDTVKAGQVIALIDTIPLATEVGNAQAALFKTKTSLVQQQNEFQRYTDLLTRNAVDESDYELEEATYDAALSSYESAEQDLLRAETNLGYATIRAPIRGIIINRNVNVGQTVAASFNTPTLFTIGNDPHIMQVTASIDEADIGWLQKGQDVNFTVETYPNRIYKGKVFQVRLQPITNQNVVTYSVMINVINADLTLLPGMTATLTVKVSEHKNVLLAPMAAFFFNPKAGANFTPSKNSNKQTIWIVGDGKTDTLPTANKNKKYIEINGAYMYCDTVSKIMQDGVTAEIEGPDIGEGMKILTGIVKTQGTQLKSLLPTATSSPAAGAARSIGK